MSFLSGIGPGGDGTPVPRPDARETSAKKDRDPFDLALLFALGGFRSELLLSADGALWGGSATGGHGDSRAPVDPTRGDGGDARTAGGAGQSAAAAVGRSEQAGHEAEMAHSDDPVENVRARGRERATPASNSEANSGNRDAAARQSPAATTSRAEAAEVRVAVAPTRAAAASGDGGRLMLSSAWRTLARSTVSVGGMKGNAPQQAPAETGQARTFELFARGSRPATSVVVPFDDGAGVEGRIRLALRGESLHATILSADRNTLHRLGNQVSEIQRALVERGFAEAQVTIRDAGQGEPSGRPQSDRQPAPDRDPRDQYSSGDRRSDDRLRHDTPDFDQEPEKP